MQEYALNCITNFSTVGMVQSVTTIKWIDRDLEVIRDSGFISST